MIRSTLTLLVAAAALAGCDQSDHTVTANEPYDPQANVVANAGPVELPPAITASKIYRCKDNSVVYIDWLSDTQGNKTAQVRTDRNKPATRLAADENGALVAEGYKLIGSAEAKTVTLTLPDKGAQACHA